MDIKEDIKVFVASYIKDINAVDEILKTKHINFKRFFVSNSDNIDIHKLYNEFYELKKILQLYINSIYHYEIYNNCISQTNDIGMIQNKRWQEEEIIELVYSFIKCFTTLQFVENNTLKEKSRLELDLNISNCPICDSDISPGDIKCGICEEPVTHCNRMKIEYDDDKKRTETIKDTNGNLKNVENVNVRPNCMTDRSIDVHNDNTNKVTLLSNNSDKWLCDECTCLNDYQNGLCVACELNKEECGVWCCGSCTFINKMKDKTCQICFEINGLINWKSETNAPKKPQLDKKKPQLDKKKYNKTKKETWQCNCKNIHSISENHICEQHSDGNIEKSINGSNSNDTTKQKSKIDGRQNTQNSKFDKGVEPNKTKPNVCVTKQSSGKNTDVKLHTEPDKKKCWYRNCRKEIQATDDFCPHCKISIQESYDKDGVVFKMNKNKKTLIWVCSICDKCNKMTDDKCTSKCKKA